MHWCLGLLDVICEVRGSASWDSCVPLWTVGWHNRWGEGRVSLNLRTLIGFGF